MKKIGLPLVIAIALSGCVSTNGRDGRPDNSHFKTLFSETSPYQKKLYGKLERTGEVYRFTELSFSPRQGEDAWVDLVTKKPIWNYTHIQRCYLVTLSGNDSDIKPCTRASEAKFMERKYDLISNVGKGLQTLGIANAIHTFMLVEFQYENYVQAFDFAKAKLANPESFEKIMGLLSNNLSKLDKIIYDYNAIVGRYNQGLDIKDYPKLSTQTNFTNFDELKQFATSISKEIENTKLKAKRLNESLTEYFIAQQKKEFKKLNIENKDEMSLFLHKFKNHKFSYSKLIAKAESQHNRLEAIEIKQKRKQELEDKRNALAFVTNPNNVGKKICKDGVIKYQFNGYNSFYRESGVGSEESYGQLSAFIEAISPDKNMIQIRIANVYMKYVDNYVGVPRMNDIHAQIGSVTWDGKNGWYPCTNS
ncbi:hypothetical protein H4J58_15500 [Colwellia sp. MB3u-70]|uniref:hypothetical protein n=1 Tax=unclassified Colwellia TaxID=196834 RepID=UPI0015F5D4BF|nr:MULTISPECIES: hypothetical protein [unclassified Colwellia]MBA6291871.1 hypothetical protein [Colwellia sp. MB3u-8]MBA6308515.1 hypothetical protein [Colwellia sp. MB3u-70]